MIEQQARYYALRAHQLLTPCGLLCEYVTRAYSRNTESEQPLVILPSSSL